MNERRLVVVGGGAAGFFAAITAAENSQGVSVILLEKGPQFLSKVRISGGGRCNVTHACFEPGALVEYYPRGSAELLGPFHVFQPRDTVAWFEGRGVRLKTETDGRMFPVSDSSATIVECLVSAAQRAGVVLRTHAAVERVSQREGGGFELRLANQEVLSCERLMLATGGCRGPGAGDLATSLGHSLQPPVPSLFTFHIDSPWLRDLAGVSVPLVEVAVPTSRLEARGALLITHTGLSGPAILRLSAWGARALHQLEYRFELQVDWLPELPRDVLASELESRRSKQGARLVVNTPVAPLPARLWEALVLAAGIARETRWASLSRAARQQLTEQLQAMPLPVTGKSLNKDEFVTCGGVTLREVNFKTMESRLCPGLYFGGEVLDIDGLTGGFNFQSAWTTGWLAGHAMAAGSARS